MAIVITGANRGIGRGLRDHYGAAGQTVYGTTRSGVAEPTGTQAGGWVPLDLRDPGSFAHLGQSLDSVAVDLLICNAGVYLDRSMKLADGFPPEAWAESFAVNVTGVFLTIQTLLPNLQMADAPRIAILSSMMGATARAPGGSYIYRASKAAATNLGRNLATDLEPLGIAVGIYHPGWVQTDMGGAAAEVTVDASVAGLADRIAALDLGRTGVVESFDGTPVPY